jgi:ankyrin repeat protein
MSRFDVCELVNSPKHLLNPQTHNCLNDLRTTDRLFLECLRDLKLTNPSKDKQAIEEKDICIPNLCTWIFETSTFSNWQEDGKSNFFWLFGSAGKGKTWLAMRIISELESRSDNIVAYFFCDDKHDQRNKAAHVLRGLLWQLLQKDHQLFEFMRKDYIEHRKDLFEGSNLWQILEKFLAKLGERQIFFVIDGLDELEPKSCKMLLDKIVSLRSTNKSKWLLTGRKEGYIEECQKDDHLVVDLYDHECTVKEQVEKYIRIRLEELQERKCYDEEAKERMRINISQRSEGTFLWTWLVFRKIEEASKFTAETVVNGVPSGLNEYFKTMLQRIQRKPLADSALAVSILVATFFALQPLEVRDLMVVADLPQEKVKDEKDMLKLVGLCCSYLEVRAGKVSFVHQYAKDYLATDEAGLGLTKGSMSKQSEIAERCFRYTCENYKSPNTTAQMSYPALFWPSHAKAAANEFSSARETCFDFFLDDSEVRMNWFSRYWLVTEGSTDAPSGFTILHLAAYLGVSPWIKDDTRNLRFLNARDSHNTTPLMRAVHRQHCEAAHLLLEKGANTSIATTGGSTLLYRAVYNDDINMVKLLLSKTSSPLLQKFLEFMLGEGIKNVMLEWLTNLIPHRFGTRLYWAAYYGKPAEMKRLLKGSGANASDRETPLSQAVAKGNTKIVKLLLGSAANPNGRQGEPTLYRTVFMSKEYPGMKEMVYELLDRGASVGREEPLYTAVWSTSSSSTEIVQLLLDYGANPNSKSHESPLYRATLYRDVKMVTKLLEKGAHPIADEYALYRAVCNENVSVVRLLLNHNADPNIGCGDTPLLQAMWHEDDFATARLLLDAGARPTDSLGAPLIRALSNGDFEIAKLLVGKGANPNIDCGPSLLYHAQWHNILELTKSLLQRGAVTYGGSPLYLAVYHQNFELAKALLKNGADPNYAIGETPLWRAVMKNFPELVRLDLEYDACPDTPCHETPLLRACYNNNTEIAELLLCAGAHPEVVGGEFPIARATWNGNKDVQDLLLGKGAVGFDVHPPQRTPLYWAERHGNEYLASKLRVPYKEKPKRLFHLTHFTPSILASMILTILIIVLWYFHSYSLRLGAMFLFTMLLSVCLSLFMMAIRSKLLTTTIDSVFLKPLRLLRS